MFSFLSFKNNRTFFLFYCIFILHFIAGSVSVLCFSPREQISLDLWDKQQYVRVFKLRKAGFSEQWVSNRVVSSDWSKSVWVTFSLASNLANQEWAFLKGQISTTWKRATKYLSIKRFKHWTWGPAGNTYFEASDWSVFKMNNYIFILEKNTSIIKNNKKCIGVKMVIVTSRMTE